MVTGIGFQKVEENTLEELELFRTNYWNVGGYH